MASVFHDARQSLDLHLIPILRARSLEGTSMSEKGRLESKPASRIAAEWDAPRGWSGPKACPRATVQKSTPYVHTCPRVDPLSQLSPVRSQDLRVLTSHLNQVSDAA